MGTYSIGIDIGTTSTKVIIFTDDGDNIQQVSVKSANSLKQIMTILWYFKRYINKKNGFLF